jgi:hypothetical protein
MMNDELERWKEQSGYILRYYPSIHVEGLRKSTKDLSHDRRSSGRNLNPGPPEYETGVLTSRTVLSVQYKVLFEKLIVSQLVKKFPAYYETRRIVTVFIRATNGLLMKGEIFESGCQQILCRHPLNDFVSVLSNPYHLAVHDQHYHCSVMSFIYNKCLLLFEYFKSYLDITVFH